MTDVDVSRYQRLTEVEHVLQRPGMYLGSVDPSTQTCWVVGGDKMVERELTFSPALIKMFDEIISNSVDEHIRSGGVKNIWVETHAMTGEISIRDDGGIPVVRHPEYNVFVPEMIFSEFRTGSNFGDDDRSTAGLNGLGSKLTSVFSTSFKVDTCDGAKRFVQVFRNNLSERGTPVVQPCKDKGTTITFTPDYARLNCELDADNMAKIERRVYDVAGCNPGIRVHYNGVHIKFGKFADYAAMYASDAVVDAAPDFDVVVAASDSGFKHVAFVNGIDTFNGGTHVDYVSGLIVAKIRDFIKKKHKVDVKPAVIKQQLFVVMKCRVNAPMFTSQTKEYLSTEVKNYGTSYAPSDKFVKKILDSDVVQKVLDWVDSEKRREELAELRKLNKTTAGNNFLKRIAKFDDATDKDRRNTTIYFTEGDSAAKTVLSARDGVKHGVFPLKGKLINVRDVKVTKLTANDEFQNIIAILGLKVGVKVESADDLRFGKIVAMTDQDPDGMHISGLFFNMINQFWPELFELGVIYRMRTPLIIATKGSKIFEFFNTEDYNDWAALNPGHSHKYYKGLGGYNTKDFKRFLAAEDEYLQQIVVVDDADIAALDIAFDKSKADDRKVWLQEN